MSKIKKTDINETSLYTRSINLLEDDPLEEIFALNLGDFFAEHLITPEFAGKISRKAKEKDKKQVLIQVYQFVKYRLLSLIIDVLLMYVFVELIKMDDMIAKVINQVIVIVLNYVFSKLFVFKSK